MILRGCNLEVVCKLEFAYHTQQFQVSAQAARFTKKSTWSEMTGGGLVSRNFFLPCSKFTGQSVFLNEQSSCGQVVCPRVLRVKLGVSGTRFET